MGRKCIWPWAMRKKLDLGKQAIRFSGGLAQVCSPGLQSISIGVEKPHPTSLGMSEPHLGFRAIKG